jgi:hypothetical protein
MAILARSILAATTVATEVDSTAVQLLQKIQSTAYPWRDSRHDVEDVVVFQMRRPMRKSMCARHTVVAVTRLPGGPELLHGHSAVIHHGHNALIHRAALYVWRQSADCGLTSNPFTDRLVVGCQFPHNRQATTQRPCTFMAVEERENEEDEVEDEGDAYVEAVTDLSSA